MAAGMLNHWQLSAFSQDEYKILSSPILLFFSYVLSGFASLQKLEEESPLTNWSGTKNPPAANRSFAQFCNNSAHVAYIREHGLLISNIVISFNFPPLKLCIQFSTSKCHLRPYLLGKHNLLC
jgi:hypothetical protein